MMSRAVLSVLLAIMPAFCLGTQDPKSPSAGQTQPPPTQQTAPGAEAGAGAVTPPQTTAPPAAPTAAPTDAAKPAEAKPSPDAGVSVNVPVDANTFVIGPEDELDIKVWEQPQLSGAVRVRSDGMITVPLLKNEIRAAGLTLLALRQVITEELGASALKDPQVTVNLLAAHSKKYWLYGQVKSPGEKELIMPTTILQAIVSAGGFLDFANQKDIAIARGDTRFKFNFKEVMAGKNLKQNIYLESGDIIYVK
jgi:polysaccharide export outer membrane protein